MSKQSLQQNLSQKLVPRQIQLMKLIQLPQIDMEARIREELEENPALELVSESKEDEYDKLNDDEDYNDDYTDDDIEHQSELDMALTSQYDYNSDDDHDNFGYQLKTKKSFIEQLQEQIYLADYDKEETIILKYLIGSLNEEGYLELSLDQINDELAFKEGIFVDEDALLKMLNVIQSLEPLGVGARDLQECLLLQIKPIKDANEYCSIAYDIILNNYEWLTRRNYDQLKNHYQIDDEYLKTVLQIITSLNPKPGLSAEENSMDTDDMQIVPDFLAVSVNNTIQIYLLNDHSSKVRLSADFERILETVDEHSHSKKEISKTKSFIHKNIDNAKWFLEALEQRKNTLLHTMQTIANYQSEYLLTGDESKIKPLILKTIAEKIDMDISTISRVVSSKFVQTEFGIIPLKKFFSDFVVNIEGEEVSITKIKNQLVKIIDEEDKANPYNDEQLTQLLNSEGYTLARRTIAKYREQLQIPVATLRKEL